MELAKSQLLAWLGRCLTGFPQIWCLCFPLTFGRVEQLELIVVLGWLVVLWVMQLAPRPALAKGSLRKIL